MILFKNEKVAVSIRDEEKQISFSDLEDSYNGTRGFTRNVRGIKKAVEALKKLSESAEKEQVNFWQISKILDSFKLNTHTWCSVD